MKSAVADFSFKENQIPVFAEPLHVGCPNIGSRSRFNDFVNDIFDRKWLTNNGKYVLQLEKLIAEYLHVKHCILFTNATIALDVVGRAVGLKGKVIVPSFTFVATAHSLLWQNVTPVFCDIDPETHNLNPEEVLRLITPDTSGILAVHVWGRPCAIRELEKIAADNNLKLIFDAAHAFGCSFENAMIGNFGEAEVFSFHATKFFNTFEGGAVVTTNDQLAEQVKLLRNFGFRSSDDVISIGTNGKMSEVSAAMGIVNLESVDEFIARNQENYFMYLKLFARIPGFKMVQYDLTCKNNFQYIIFEVDPAVTGYSRDQLAEYLHFHNVLVRKYFYPGCHNMAPYRSLEMPHGSLSVTDRVASQVLSFPNGMAVNNESIFKIAELILKFGSSVISGRE